MSNENNEKEFVLKLPVAQSNMTEGEALEYLRDLVKAYKEMEKKVYIQYASLINKKEAFPRKYLDNVDFEDLMIQAASAKFDAIKVARLFSGLSADISVELDFLTANFKLNIADDALSEKFDKITEGLRDAYVASKIEIKDLIKLNDRVSNYADSAEKLIKAFDSDEINFRRIADNKNKLKGFS